MNRRDLIRNGLAAGAMLALPARALGQDLSQDFDKAFGLNPAAPPPVPAPAVEEPDEPEDEKKGKRPGGPRAPLAERLTSIELAGGMSKLAGRVKSECSELAMRNMTVGLRIEVGANGKVISASPMGLQSGALGSCVAKVAKTAKYRAAREGAEFEYTFRM